MTRIQSLTESLAGRRTPWTAHLISPLIKIKKINTWNLNWSYLWWNYVVIDQMRFIGQNALILVKLGVVLTNTAFGEWIGTELTFRSSRLAHSGQLCARLFMIGPTLLYHPTANTKAIWNTKLAYTIPDYHVWYIITTFWLVRIELPKRWIWYSTYLVYRGRG